MVRARGERAYGKDRVKERESEREGGLRIEGSSVLHYGRIEGGRERGGGGREERFFHLNCVVL